jgi:hypothetical protein
VLLAALCTSCTCSHSQPGCTAENCQAMLDCAVEFSAEPASLCLVTNKVPVGFDSSSYCVHACNETPNGGTLAQCFADNVATCRDGGFMRFAMVQNICFPPVDGGITGTTTCEDECYSTRTTCDDKCTGGKACDTCLRGGATSCPCPDAGLTACLDCSTPCGDQYESCVQHCP